jgi:hypothetical protein
MSLHTRSRLGMPVCAQSGGQSSDSALLLLPSPVLDLVLARLDSSSLVAVNSVCKALRAFDANVGLRLADKAAKARLEAACGVEQASRWRWVHGPRSAPMRHPHACTSAQRRMQMVLVATYVLSLSARMLPTGDLGRIVGPCPACMHSLGRLMVACNAVHVSAA